MLVVQEIKYSQICNFWQSVCELRVWHFCSISLISVPPFPFIELSELLQKSKKNYFIFFLCDSDERISRYTLINNKSWH